MMTIETDKHYLIENYSTKKFECYKVLNIADTVIQMLQIPSNVEKEMNKNYATEHAQPCPITDEILPFFGFQQIDNSPAFKSDKEILIRFKQFKGFESTNRSEKIEIKLIGYAKISESELDKTNEILLKQQDDNWERTIRDNYNIITTIDELLGGL